MATAPLPFLTAEQYLEIERKAEFRSEYLHGEMFAMAGAGVNHNLIASRTASDLLVSLRGRGCGVFVSDQRIHIPATGLYTYPDIAVICRPFQFAKGTTDTITNPLLIVEVLSDSTRNYDRGEKFLHYRSIPGFREYLLLSQHEIRAEHHVRQNDGSWVFREFTLPGDTITLESIACTLELTSLYEMVEFPPAV